MKQKKSNHFGILSECELKQPKYKLLYGIIFVFLCLMVLVNTVPTLWIMLSGFKSVQEMYAIPTTFFPKEIHFSKLLEVWNRMSFYKFYVNTFIMAGGCVLFNILVCGFAGYSLSKLKPIGSGLIFVLCVWIMMLPGTTRTVPLYMIIKDFPIFHFNMLDSYLPIWLMAAASTFGIILFKNFFDGISPALVESARIDGANDLRIFFQIIVPLSIPIFTVTALLTFNGQLGQFFWPYLLIQDKSKTVLGVQIFKLKSSDYTMDYQMIALLFSLIPQLVIFAIFQKQIIGGLNLGGVKG